MPGDSALAYRRQQLDARPIVTLFHQLCQPIATTQTPSAFLFGLPAMALDGTSECVPDTPANVAAFGRHITGRGASAFPLVQGDRGSTLPRLQHKRAMVCFDLAEAKDKPASPLTLKGGGLWRVPKDWLPTHDLLREISVRGTCISQD